MSENNAAKSKRTCIVPGCTKELPHNSKGPFCVWHRGEIRDKGAAAAGAIAAVGVGGLQIARRYGPQIVSKAVEVAKLIKLK